MEWIKAWMSKKRQKVVIGQVAGEWKKVPSGVFQGSVLGVIFAILFGDSIDQAAGNGRLDRFVDDNKYSVTVTKQEDTERLQKTINDISNWAQSWGIAMNPDKCCFFGVWKLRREERHSNQLRDERGRIEKKKFRKRFRIVSRRSVVKTSVLEETSAKGQPNDEDDNGQFSNKREKRNDQIIQDLCKTVSRGAICGGIYAISKKGQGASRKSATNIYSPGTRYERSIKRTTS